MNLSLSRPAAAVVVGADEEGDASDHEPEPYEDPLRQQSFAAAPRRRPPPAPPGGVQEEDPREHPRERAPEEQLELAGEGVASWLKFYVFSSVQTLSKFGKGVWAAVSELGDDFVGEVACSRSRNTARSRREKAALIACLQELHKEEAREQQLQQQQAQAEQAVQPQQEEHQEGKQDLQTVERSAIDQFSQAVKMGPPSSGSCSSASGGSCRSAEGPHMISALPSAPAFSRVSSTETSGTCTDVDGEARSTVTLEELHFAVRESRLQAAKIVVSPVALHNLGKYLLSEEDQAKMYHWALLLRFRRQLRGPQRDGRRAQEMSASSCCAQHEEEAPEDRERGKGRRDLFPLQEAAGAARQQQMEEEEEEEEELEGRWGSKASSSMSPPQETSETTPERSPESGSDSATSGADTWLNLESTAGARPFRTVLKKKPQRPRSNSVLSSASTMAPSSDSDAGQSRRSSTVGLASAADSDNEDSKILAEQLSALSLCSETETRSPALAPAGAPAPVVRPPPPPDPSVGEQFLHSIRLQLADLRAPSIPEHRTLDGRDEDGNKQQTSACSDHDQMEMEMDMEQQSCSTSCSEEVEELDGDFLEEEFSLRIERLNTGEVTVRRSPSFISDPGRESEESRRSGGDFVEGTLLLPEECKPVEWRHENSTPRGRVVVSPPVAKELSLKKKEAKGNDILRRGAGAGSACASAGFDAEKISAKVDQEQEEQALGAKIPWDKFFRWFFQEAMIAGWFCEPGAKRCKITGPLPPHYHLAHNNCQHLVYRFFRDVLELQQTPKFFSSTICRTSPLEGWRAAEGGSSGIADETDVVETCSRSSKSAVLEEVGEVVEGTGSRSAGLAAPGVFEENSTSASMKKSGPRRISSGTASANRSSSADPGLATLLCAGTRARKRDKRSVAMGGGTITNQERRGCTLMKNGLVAPAPICRPTPPKLKVKRTDFHSRAAGRAFLTPLVTPSLLAEGQASETPGIRSTRRRKRKHFLKVAPHNSQIAVVQRNRNENGRRRFQLQEGQEHQLQQEAETKSKSKGGESHMTTTSESSDATASRKTSSSTRAAKKIQCEPWLRATSPLACRILGTSVPDADTDPERRRCNDNFAEFQRFVYGASQDQRDPPLFPCCGHGRKEMLQTEDGGRLLV
eukprot:g11896.t1